MADAQPGQTFDVKTEKDDKGYWQWTSVERVAPGAAAEVAPAPSASTSRSASANTAPAQRTNTYETPEERAIKQVYIVKQSSVANAIALLSVGVKSPPSVDAVLETAQKFTDFVFGKPDLFKQANDLPQQDDEFQDVPL